MAGDELGRTQQGNNNAYCQDNALSYIDWENADHALLLFVGRLLELRREHPVFRRRRWFQGRPVYGSGLTDIAWFRPDGTRMGDEDWDNGFAKSMAVFLNGEEIAAPDPRGQRVVDDSFLIMFNAHYEPIRYTVPRGPWGWRWLRVLDTHDPLPRYYRAGAQVPVKDRSLVLLRRVE
jgi:glycogen operon protein